MADDDERKCRICLEGDVPALGRLIKPCKCDGSIRYVHLSCLNQWRHTSTTRSAFFQCPQCRYKYHFARTRVVGLATSPFVISFFSLNLFIILVFSASFIGSFILNVLDDSDSTSDSYYSYWFYNPISAARDLVTSAVRILDDVTSDRLSSSTGRVDWSHPTPYKLADTQPGIIARLVRRFILGLSVVGITSFIQWLWSMSALGTMRFPGLRSRRDRERSALSIIIIVFVIAGAARALLQVYRFVERGTKQFLIRAEYTILEVGD